MALLLAVVGTLLFSTALGAILFASAGTIHEPMFWVYIGCLAVFCLAALAVVQSRSPDLIAERMNPGAGERDNVTIWILNLTLISHCIIAGLDVGRYHWTRDIPPAAQIVGLAAMYAGFAVVLWAMLVNRFFSSAVRLQFDRGHHVITTGPYRFVRHPGYTGGIVFLLFSGVALGSWLSILPILIATGFIVRRALLEDTMLQQELPGYLDYARSVRFRLIPGIW